jgi:uncharacterized FAD-dependent dehydrogenase
MLRVSNFKININNEKDIKDILRKRLGLGNDEEMEFKIVKKSIDARDKNDILYVYSIDIKVNNEEKLLKEKFKNFNISLAKDENYYYPKVGDEILKHRPVIVGFGPAGMFASLLLARCGYKPIILERGKDIEERDEDVRRLRENRILNSESNIQFGIGGAGTYSDGKLNTLVNDRYGRNKFVLEEFVKHGAPEEILYLQKPHVGTDKLKAVEKNIKEEIESLGGEIRFSSKFDNIIIEDGKVTEIIYNKSQSIKTNIVVLALGHSARDTFYMLNEKKIFMEQKPFAIGARIEHSQEMINKWQYGKDYKKLPAADYKLVHHLKNGRSVFTFCMCPGGLVVPATSEENMVVTNGMSNFKRDTENANSALLVNIIPQDFSSNHPLAGIEFQRELEKRAFIEGGKNYNAPCQLVGDFLGEKAAANDYNIKPTYKPGVTFADLNKCLPDFVSNALKEGIKEFNKSIKGFAAGNAILTGVETRSSAPLRITRNEEF